MQLLYITKDTKKLFAKTLVDFVDVYMGLGSLDENNPLYSSWRNANSISQVPTPDYYNNRLYKPLGLLKVVLKRYVIEGSEGDFNIELDDKYYKFSDEPTSKVYLQTKLNAGVLDDDVFVFQKAWFINPIITEGTDLNSFIPAIKVNDFGLCYAVENIVPVRLSAMKTVFEAIIEY